MCTLLFLIFTDHFLVDTPALRNKHHPLVPLHHFRVGKLVNPPGFQLAWKIGRSISGSVASGMAEGWRTCLGWRWINLKSSDSLHTRIITYIGLYMSIYIYMFYGYIYIYLYVMELQMTYLWCMFKIGLVLWQWYVMVSILQTPPLKLGIKVVKDLGCLMFLLSKRCFLFNLEQEMIFPFFRWISWLWRLFVGTGDNLFS